MSRAINQLVRQFVTDLGAAAESEVTKRIRAAVIGVARTETAHPASEPRLTSAKARAGARVASPARRLQGQYIWRLRALTGRDRAQVSAIAKEKGVAEAVRLARKILGR